MDGLKRIILASKSPRRQELMQYLGIEIICESRDTDETCNLSDPGELVSELAKRKAIAVASSYPHDLVVGADTIVVIDNMVLGKPKDASDAIRMLTMLSGRWHEVYTGVAMIKGDQGKVFYEKTRVKMHYNSPALIDAYVRSGEPLDKAGAYGIQGQGALLIEGIEGDYYNVMGLPIARLYREL